MNKWKVYFTRRKSLLRISCLLCSNVQPNSVVTFLELNNFPIGLVANVLLPKQSETSAKRFILPWCPFANSVTKLTRGH